MALRKTMCGGKIVVLYVVKNVIQQSRFDAGGCVVLIGFIPPGAFHPSRCDALFVPARERCLGTFRGLSLWVSKCIASRAPAIVLPHRFFVNPQFCFYAVELRFVFFWRCHIFWKEASRSIGPVSIFGTAITKPCFTACWAKLTARSWNSSRAVLAVSLACLPFYARSQHVDL